MKVYVLINDYADGDGYLTRVFKGVYSSQEKAINAVEREWDKEKLEKEYSANKETLKKHSIKIENDEEGLWVKVRLEIYCGYRDFIYKDYLIVEWDIDTESMYEYE